MALVQRTDNTLHATHWQGAIPLNYRYTAGRAGQKFLMHLKDKGELLATTCNDCGVTYMPAAIFCERCLARLEDTYEALPARGEVHAVTVCHEDYRGTRRDEPSIVAMIRVDGTEGGLLHWLGELEAKEVTIGMKVEAVLEPAGKRVGSILDIRYFKPVG
ncbi:MAG: Zn-ribbon domain-containing OB-fold protein [Acidobacteriota bacterium]|nr:MAG: Zn-ribbon domain-containing OB-fold protein [Acidobacteriota bacterium]